MTQETTVPFNCHKCVHRIPIPGNCHIGCNNPSSDLVKAHWPGCGYFPISFDPLIIRLCNAFSTDPKDALPINNDSLLDLARLLMR